MKKYIILSIIVAFTVLSAIVGVQCSRIKSISADRDRLNTNQNTLLSAVDTFKVADSLNAIKVKRLNLTVGEYKKYRSEDLKTIKLLTKDVKRLQQVGTINTETNYKFKTDVKDSTVFHNTLVIDSLQCARFSNKWLDFIGCYNQKKEFEGIIQSRDSLIYEEHIIPKRFLGFLWKYGCKERRQNIISKNPYTKIVSAEFITIKD